MDILETLWGEGAVAAAAGLAIGAALYTSEALGFHLCRLFEGLGLFQRFVPSTTDPKRQFTQHPVANLFNVGVPYFVLYWGLLHKRRLLWERADWSFAPLHTWLFIWVVMVLHDMWFFHMHTLFHTYKPVYRYIHQRHHENGAVVTALATAYGEMLDISLCFVSFHWLLAAWIVSQPSWNVPGVVLLVVFEVVTDITGHCGYRLPLWAHVLATGGVGLTPFAATSKTHYIHHLDPRYNKGLYFTLWDRLYGSYTDSHILIPAPSVAAPRQSNAAHPSPALHDRCTPAQERALGLARIGAAVRWNGLLSILTQVWLP